MFCRQWLHLPLKSTIYDIIQTANKVFSSRKFLGGRKMVFFLFLGVGRVGYDARPARRGRRSRIAAAARSARRDKHRAHANSLFTHETHVQRGI